MVLLPGEPARWSQLLPAPSPPLVIAALAALAYLGAWLYKRWRAVVERQRQLDELMALNQVQLVRQKQRFERALVVDSVNLELPPIKEMDVQPGPVRVEELLARGGGGPREAGGGGARPQARTSQAPPQPHLDDGSMREWRHFMAASRVTEVKNVSDNRRTASNPQVTEQPSLDSAALANLSERIRRAGEPGSDGIGGSGTAAAQKDIVITFEQLYANSRESDEEAMARRAAERKARWQQQQGQQQGQPTGGAPSAGRSAADGGPHPRMVHAQATARTAEPVGRGLGGASGPSPASAAPAATQSQRPRPQPPSMKPGAAPSADNPFIRGMQRPSAAASAPIATVTSPSEQPLPSHGMRPVRGQAESMADDAAEAPGARAQEWRVRQGSATSQSAAAPASSTSGLARGARQYPTGSHAPSADAVTPPRAPVLAPPLNTQWGHHVEHSSAGPARQAVQEAAMAGNADTDGAGGSHGQVQDGVRLLLRNDVHAVVAGGVAGLAAPGGSLGLLREQHHTDTGSSPVMSHPLTTESAGGVGGVPSGRQAAEGPHSEGGSPAPRRAPAVGPLRTPDAHEPGLVRLMRRPTAAVGVCAARAAAEPQTPQQQAAVAGEPGLKVASAAVSSA